MDTGKDATCGLGLPLGKAAVTVVVVELTHRGRLVGGGFLEQSV